MRIDSPSVGDFPNLYDGARTGDANSRIRPAKPRITIVTATFNAVQYLPRTIKSIRELTYDNVEWIVVDGGSTDGTIELLQKNEDVVDQWISEPDHGIYDAWNKGICLANGDWIAFLGAGDAYRQHALTDYLNVINSSAHVPGFISSKVAFVNGESSVLRVWGSAFEWSAFKKYMNIAHVGALHHKKLFVKHGGFNTSYASSADYEFLMRCGKQLNALFLDSITADMLVGGVSNGYNSIFETYLVQKRFGVGLSAKFRYWLACAKRFVRPIVRGY